MKKLKVGIIGTGSISDMHMDAVKRVNFAELVAVYDPRFEIAREKADKYLIPHCYKKIDEILNDDGIDVIHNCTPNFLHAEINEKIIKAGKHVLSEKPLAISSKDSKRLLEVINENPDIVAGVNFNYRMYPLVQEMKIKIKKGDIGKPITVFGSYLQDYMIDGTLYHWILEKDKGGPSFCLANTGSHWIDAVQTVLADKIVEVCSDLTTYFKTRKKTKESSGKNNEGKNLGYEDKNIEVEEYGAVLFKMSNGVHGVFYVSQLSAGRKLFFNFEIDGTKGSMYWNAESADRMWMGFSDKHNLQIIRNPSLVSEEVQQYTSLPAGHTEGHCDAMRNNVYSFYKYILDGKKLGKDTGDFGTFKDGHYVVKVIEAALESYKSRKWEKVKQD